ncbi:MAG: hypothetical protein IJN57_11400 [Oscillospiraceae bacterium]|nr:hypothetical protein [Oscillospiraceae bacterium]
MIHIRPGSQTQTLIMLLSTVGEFPTRSLHLLGNERVYKALVHRLTSPETFRNSMTGEEMTVRLLTVTGKASGKTVRLYKAALPILEWIGGKDYYLSSFWNHKFPGDAAHKERNHRVAEAVAMCMRAGVAYRPYLLPTLQNREIRSVIPKYPALYLAKDIKRVGEEEINKTMFTRLTGALYTDGSCYAVYNTRNAVMKWHGKGEFKAMQNLVDISRLNAGISRVDSAVLFGESEKIALDTLLLSDKMDFRFDSVYRHVHFIPLNEFGIRLLSLMLIPDWNAQLLDLLFDPEARSYNKGVFEYDAFVDGVYVLSHLDGDIARLIRFRDSVYNRAGRFEVLCYPDQVLFLREYLGPNVSIKTIGIDSVEAELGRKQEE